MRTHKITFVELTEEQKNKYADYLIEGTDYGATEINSSCVETVEDGINELLSLTEDEGIEGVKVQLNDLLEFKHNIIGVEVFNALLKDEIDFAIVV